MARTRFMVAADDTAAAVAAAANQVAIPASTYANGRLMRDTIADKNAKTADRIQKDAEAAKEVSERRVANKNTVTKLAGLGITADAPGKASLPSSPRTPRKRYTFVANDVQEIQETDQDTEEHTGASTHNRPTPPPAPPLPASPPPHPTSLLVEELPPSVKVVKIEVLPYNQRLDPNREANIVYINARPIRVDQSGKTVCNLSEVITLASEFDSPLKGPKVKLWLVGTNNQPITLGRGGALKGLPTFVNEHTMKTEATEQGEEILTGITILTQNEEDNANAVPQHSRADPDSPSRKTKANARVQAKAKGKSTKKSAVSASRSNVATVHIPDSDEGDSAEEITEITASHVEKIDWLRQHFLLVKPYPGQVVVTTARQALDRYKKVSRAQQAVRNWQSLIPSEGDLAPDSLRGLRISQAELMEAFGFSETTWWDLPKRWDVNGALRGAHHVIAWTHGPDTVIEGTGRPLYDHLNGLSFNKLKGVVERDRNSRYDPRDPSNLAPSFRSSSSSSHHRRDRSPPRHDHCGDDRRHGESSRGGGGSRPGKRRRSTSFSSEQLDSEHDESGDRHVNGHRKRVHT